MHYDYDVLRYITNVEDFMSKPIQYLNYMNSILVGPIRVGCMI